MNKNRRVQARRAILRLAVAVTAATLAVAGSGVAHAKGKATPSPSVLKAPYGSFANWSSCDDGGGTSTCSMSSTGTSAGDGSATASLAAKAPLARGKAVGLGGLRSAHTLRSPVAGLRYRFVFDNVDAATATTPPLIDLAARASVGGYVLHSKCDACRTILYHNVATSHDPTRPASVNDQTYSFDVEVRNPSGPVPAGTLSVWGLSSADVRPYEARPDFVSSGTSSVSGRLAQVEVTPLAS